MNNILRILLAALLALGVAACSKKVRETPAPMDDGMDSRDRVTETMPSSSGMYTEADLDTDECLRQRVVYFDFDQANLRPEFSRIVACHAKYLQDRPSAMVTLEGHADERGSREYNLGLGERRGNAVQSAMMASGGSAGQQNVVSYGEERATCSDMGESCWAQNRRVEIVYTAR